MVWRDSVDGVGGGNRVTEEKTNQSVLLFAIGFVLLLVFGLFPYSSALQPLIAIAVLAGYLYGTERGFAVGVGALILGALFGVVSQSLFLFQLVGVGLAGVIGGIALGDRKSVSGFLALTAVSVILFEVLLNLVASVQGISNPLQPLGFVNVPAFGSMANILLNLVIALLFSGWVNEK